MAEEMRPELVKPVDETRLKVPELAKELGIWPGRVREAIRGGHYGTIHSKGGRDVFYATLSEARAYHFEGISKSKKPTAKSKLINTSK